MPSSPLVNTHVRTTSGVACHHRPWTAYMVGRYRMWHVIITHGQHTWSDDVQCRMPSSPFHDTNDRITSCVECHHRPRVTHTFGRRRAWHAIIALGQHTRSDDIGHGMLSLPLERTHSQTMSSVACHHRPLAAYIIVDADVSCHHLPCGAHTF